MDGFLSNTGGVIEPRQCVNLKFPKVRLHIVGGKIINAVDVEGVGKPHRVFAWLHGRQDDLVHGQSEFLLPLVPFV